MERLAAGGVLSKETHETVIRFAPPLTISYELIDRAVEIFRAVLAEIPEWAWAASLHETSSPR